MRKLPLDEMATRMGPSIVRKPLSDALGTGDVAVNYYELDTGETLSYGLHAHAEQEEIFYVVAGTVTFETRDGTTTVGADELVRFGPGEYQHGHNDGGERARVLAIGAPRDPGETEVLRSCPDCDDRTPHEIELAEDGDHVRSVCTICGAVTARFD
ncbi:cupin domain-containing protein [Halobacteriales archaeon SW_7_68_16]|nr:MAG: cupin domain-containing protein [Halobacteriales archaeon SW_7_68_16]